MATKTPAKPQTQDAPKTPATPAPVTAPEQTLSPLDAMEAAVAAYVRHALGTGEPDTSAFDQEASELQQEIDDRTASGKNGPVLNALKRELADVQNRRGAYVAAADWEATKRITLAIQSVRHWADAANPVPKAKSRTMTRGEGHGDRTVARYVATVDGEPVSPSDNNSLSTLCHNKLRGLKAEELRDAFAAQNQGIKLSDFIVLHGAKARSVTVACPDAKSRVVTIEPLPAAKAE